MNTTQIAFFSACVLVAVAWFINSYFKDKRCVEKRLVLITRHLNAADEHFSTMKNFEIKNVEVQNQISGYRLRYITAMGTLAQAMDESRTLTDRLHDTKVLLKEASDINNSVDLLIFFHAEKIATEDKKVTV